MLESSGGSTALAQSAATLNPMWPHDALSYTQGYAQTRASLERRNLGGGAALQLLLVPSRSCG